MIAAWKARARAIKIEVYSLYLVRRDPRVPWYAKALMACVVAYALSPIDLIPDFIPVVGYLDDLVLIPLGVMAVRRMVPAVVLDECRVRAREGIAVRTPVSWTAAVIIVAIWLAVVAIFGRWLLRESN